MSDQPPKDYSDFLSGLVPTGRSQQEKFDELARLGAGTFFVNRFYVQRYADGSVRITFAEQYSPHNDQPPASRTAVYMPAQVAEDLAKELERTAPAPRKGALDV